MKKLISIFVLLLAFSLSAQAQEKKQAVKTPEELAKLDVFSMSKAIDINQGSLTTDLNNLLVKKYYMLQEAKNDSEKEQVSQIIDAKLKATLTPEQLRVLSSTDLYHKLIH